MAVATLSTSKHIRSIGHLHPSYWVRNETKGPEQQPLQQALLCQWTRSMNYEVNAA